MTGRGLRIAIRRVAFALALALGETGRGPRTATGLAGIALGVTGHGLRTAADHVDGACDPLLAGEVAVTARGHMIPLAALVTGHEVTRSPSPLCDRSQPRAPPASDRSRSKDGGRRARHEEQEGVETVAVSQAPVVS